MMRPHEDRFFEGTSEAILRLVSVLGLAAVTAFVPAAQSLSGRWSAAPPGTTVTFDLSIAGPAVTGSMTVTKQDGGSVIGAGRTRNGERLCLFPLLHEHTHDDHALAPRSHVERSGNAGLPFKRISQSGPRTCLTCGSLTLVRPIASMSSAIRTNLARISTGNAESSASILVQGLDRPGHEQSYQIWYRVS